MAEDVPPDLKRSDFQAWSQGSWAKTDHLNEFVAWLKRVGETGPLRRSTLQALYDEFCSENRIAPLSPRQLENSFAAVGIQRVGREPSNPTRRDGRHRREMLYQVR